MCGFVVWADGRHGIDREELARLRDLLRHRGPDDAGCYISHTQALGLGFRRLSIIDLSPAGHQPMSNEDQAVWIMFNGEIYNFAEIRPELEARGHLFRSHTDTEVVLHAYEEWGDRCVDRFIGMFAFVIWDERTQTLFAARDRLGIKPLYYSYSSHGLLLASELKPILAAPGFDRTLDFQALRDYLAHGYICSPHTIFQSAGSLPPGHILAWSPVTTHLGVKRYWDPLEFWTPGSRTAALTDEKWMETLADLLLSAVKYRLISDVPLGAFLSGGIDSSLVVALMRQASNAEVKTFAIGFEESEHNEAEFAEAVSRHLQTTHLHLVTTHAEAKKVIPLLPRHFDEPFADSSQIPTYLVSKLTRQYVTVALSGDGGDELFCGYDHYRFMAKWWPVWQVPPSIRGLVGRAGSFLPHERYRLALAGLALPDAIAFADYYTAFWRPNEMGELVPALRDLTPAPVALSLKNGKGLLETLMLRDIQGYLPNDILTKVDRASMAVSLEARVPLLDHRVVELALRMPLTLKWRNGISKYALRQILYRHVPRGLVDRPKHGFGVPLDHWLRHDLHHLIDDYLDPARLRRQGLFDARVVSRQIARFMAGQCGHSRLWALLMFQMWAEQHLSSQNP